MKRVFSLSAGFSTVSQESVASPQVMASASGNIVQPETAGNSACSVCCTGQP
jgi:hypothetical protein